MGFRKISVPDPMHIGHKKPQMLIGHFCIAALCVFCGQ